MEGAIFCEARLDIQHGELELARYGMEIKGGLYRAGAPDTWPLPAERTRGQRPTLNIPDTKEVLNA